MRRSNWKTKVIVVIAFILSIVLGVVAAMFAPDVWKGLIGSKKTGNTDDTFFNAVSSICFAVRISGTCCRN